MMKYFIYMPLRLTEYFENLNIVEILNLHLHHDQKHWKHRKEDKRANQLRTRISSNLFEWPLDPKQLLLQDQHTLCENLALKRTWYIVTCLEVHIILNSHLTILYKEDCDLDNARIIPYYLCLWKILHRQSNQPLEEIHLHLSYFSRQHYKEPLLLCKRLGTEWSSPRWL